VEGLRQHGAFLSIDDSTGDFTGLDGRSTFHYVFQSLDSTLSPEFKRIGDGRRPDADISACSVCLFQLNPATGAAVNAPIPFEHDGNNCGSVNGFGSTTAGLFAVGAGPFGGVNSFYSIDPTTGAPTLIGSTGIIAGGGRGFLSASNDSSKLYWEVQNGSVDSLYSINTSTGAATLIGTEDESFPRQQNGNPFSMVFTGGTLWANFFSFGFGTIDASSGRHTFVSTNAPASPVIFNGGWWPGLHLQRRA